MVVIFLRCVYYKDQRLGIVMCKPCVVVRRVVYIFVWIVVYIVGEGVLLGKLAFSDELVVYFGEV